MEASIIAIRLLLLQVLSFLGYDESERSLNRGNVIALLTLLSEHDVEYSKVVLKRANGNCQLTSPVVQKDISNACEKETTKAILEDLKDLKDEGRFFVIHADESADVFDKEQMAFCLRYVNKRGEVCERFLGVVHVPNTSSLTLKDVIESLLMEYSLTFSQGRGQGYDGASDMQVSINGLKTLILNECLQAYFSLDAIVGVSDTPDSNKAQFITHMLMSFDFVFEAHLMVAIFGITNELNMALQKRDQDIVNAMSMVDVTKLNLQKMRDEEWNSHMEKVTSFMDKQGIEVSNMEGNYVVPGRRMYRDDRFWNLETINELFMKLVEAGKHATHDRVYLLLKFVSTLPVATASVERMFSGMTQVKDKLPNSMGDQMLNDCLINYLERDMFLNVNMNDIIDSRTIAILIFGCNN
ncbi:uncharacterized protein [Spinacia oleracea]|uniref:DUF4371 domain-containing protein n=1 Tax=Spinacia oleracea TaxID=3562 RepID=A0A9R0IKT8_SPIOL|nr:uncharacterized protein LOC110790726 [Spinacia oleracea]